MWQLDRGACAQEQAPACAHSEVVSSEGQNEEQPWGSEASGSLGAESLVGGEVGHGRMWCEGRRRSRLQD